jgi:dTDP-4-dehydrorhamnose 3,5-epimerase
MMEFIPTEIPDVVQIRPKVHGDARGFFMETVHEQHFRDAGITGSFVQDNHSGSHRGTLRGLHFQVRQAQGKLLRCVAGEIFDVAVDIRVGSPTFGRWVGVTLSAENKAQIWIPAGFAHGFYVLSEWGELAYKTTDYYAPDWERSLRWDDPAIGIDWPLIPGLDPILSERDRSAPFLADAETHPPKTDGTDA